MPELETVDVRALGPSGDDHDSYRRAGGDQFSEEFLVRTALHVDVDDHEIDVAGIRQEAGQVVARNDGRTETPRRPERGPQYVTQEWVANRDERFEHRWDAPTPFRQARGENMNPVFEAGVDEAGYGPILGPLVVAGLRVDGDGLALESTIGPLRRAGLVIDDSKRVFQGKHAHARLERTALIGIGLARGRLPTSVRDVCGGSVAAATDHPWYGHWDDPVPRWSDPCELSDLWARATDVQASTGASWRSSLRVLLEREYNRRLQLVPNKAAVHLETVGSVIEDLMGQEAVGGAVRCDRLGGRTDYLEFVSSFFPFMPTATERRDRTESRYRVAPAGRPAVTFEFLVGGESRAPLIAWSSCIAKYVRELLMEGFNRTFTERYRGLASTAGYAVDGSRFLRELEALAGTGSGWSERLRRIR